MHRKSLMVVLLLAFSFSAGMPVYWRAHSRSLPPSHAARIAVQAAGRGFPWVNLRDGQELLPGVEASTLLQNAAAQPLALASGDFDEDGVPDLLSGFASADGGALMWQRGNVDAIYPDTPAAEQRRARGAFTDAPFLSPARVFALPAATDFVGTGDFNADGHVDVVAAARGSATLFWLAGDGRGGLGQAQAIELPGSVTALMTGEINRADGLTDVIVGVNTVEGAQALVFEGPEGAFSRAPEVIALPTEATALALGQLDEQYEMDLAVAAGSELLIVHGRDRCLSVGEERQAEVKPAAIEEHALAFHIASLAVGDFSGDQHAEIAVLSADGVVQVLGQDARSKQWGTPLGEVATRSQRAAATTAVANDQLAPLAAPLLVRARVSVSGYDDLLVVERDQQQLQILTGGMLRGEEAQAAAEPRAPVVLAVAGEPVAVLPMRLNMDALSDLVVLKRGGESSVAAALTAPTATFTVNNNGSQGDANQNDGKCETAPGNGVCTLPAAIQQANASAGADLINFSPSISSITLPTTLGVGDVVTIDGGTNRVEISGFGLTVSGGSSTIRRLVFNRLNSNPLLLTGKGNNIVEGNYIGTDVTGANAAFGTNTGWSGLNISVSPSNTIGGTTAAARNVISSPGTGIAIQSNSPGNKVQGNYIGTDAAGAKTLLTGSSFGLSAGCANQCPNLQIGGTEAGARNVISGHSQNIQISGEAGVLIQGNLIGTDATGTVALGGNNEGVRFFGTSAATGFTIGGTTLPARNIISGHLFGVTLSANPAISAALVQGNYIGTDITGTKALGNRSIGVTFSGDVAHSTVGGTVTGARNLISANGAGGIYLRGTDNQVLGNYIGTDANGTANLGNVGQGVYVFDTNSRVGGTESGAANIIAFNSTGVAIAGFGIALRRNSIFGNGAGVNSPFSGISSNGTAPVLTTTAGTTQGTLSRATPNTAHIIEFFSNPACATDTQGKTFIGDTTVTTDASGAASFSVPAGQNVTATATATGGNTSNFSNCAAGGTGCTSFNLQANAAAPEQAQDTLELVNAQPGNEFFVRGAQLKLGGLKVTARYLLQSRAGAKLAVRLFDQAGNLRGDAGEISVTRPESCPNPLPAREFIFPSSNFDFTPKIGNVLPTSLTLSALLLDSATGAVIKRADLTYGLLANKIAFEGTPKINGEDAPDGSRVLPVNGTINFTCAISYHLTHDVTGKINVEARDALNNGIIATKQLSPVMATEEPTVWNVPLDFQFEVSPNVSEIKINVELIAENFQVLKTSPPQFSYQRSFGLVLGMATVNPLRFLPFQSALPVLVSGGEALRAFGLNPTAQSLGLGLREDLSLPIDTPYAIQFAEKLANGITRRQRILDSTPIASLPQRSWYIIPPDRIPDDVDFWELKVRFNPQNQPPVVSAPLLLPIDRVRIVPGQFSPPRSVELQRGKTEKFRYQLEYNVVRPGTSQLFAQVEYNALSGEPQPQPIKLLDLGPRDHSPATPLFYEFTAPIPINPKVTFVRVSFYLSNADFGQRAVSQPIFYREFTEELNIPSGATSVSGTLGINLSGVQNSVNRAVKAVRRGKQFKGILDSFGIKLREGVETNRFGARAWRYAEAASLLRDFIGVNAFWEFNPPIPADGSFAADLTFSYDAEMLPDDPNFSEAALKVASFDPDSGQLVSYPTTVNLAAKTATARVNSLTRAYTLGVFGPFAQRTLNFPVLRSGDDFTTRFNLVNAGTADTALTLRAYDDAGANLQAPSLVNPLTATLAAARMLTGSISDLFKAITPLDSWVQTRANRNTVAGYELLTSGNRFDGLNAPSGYDSALILPEAFYDATQTTEVHLANATNFSGVVTLELHDTTGRLAGSEEVQLEAKARFAQQLQDIFPNLAQPFTGYLLILSERDLAAAAVQVLAKEITALNAQPLGGGATTLYAPYLSLGGPTAARLTLVNPTVQAANLTLRLINKPGAPTNAPVSLTLGAGQQLQRNFSQLFTINPLSLTYSTLIVESNVAGLAGNVTLFNGSTAIPFRATLPLESAPANRLVFAHLNISDGYFTELGIFNPSAQTARVTLACFKPDGTALGQAAILSVPANTVFGNYLDNLVSATLGQAAGYFTLTSDQPIVAGAAFGTDAGSALAGLPPQILPSTSTSTLASVSAASYLGQTLAANSIVAAFGVNLANSVVIANQVPLPTTLADTIVEVRDSLGVERLAPLFFVAPGQINYLIPPGTANGTATVSVTNGAGAVSLGNVTIANVAPGLFAANANGQGVPAAIALRIKANGAQSYEPVARFDAPTQRFVSTPLDLGPTGEPVFLLLFGTGLRGRSSLAATSALIGGTSAQVSYVGPQGDFVGLDQVNVAVPRTLIGRGEVDLMLTVDGKVANTARVNIK